MASNFSRSLLLLSLLCLGLAACSTSFKANSGIIARLKNRGPVAVSADNPYLAANVLLNKEMEGSPELKGFIEKRGLPSALEVQHESFGPLGMQLYYLSERQVYILEESEGLWLIRGPEAFSSQKLSEVQNIAAFRYAAGAVSPPVPQPIRPTAVPTPRATAPIRAPTSTPQLGAFQSPSRPKLAPVGELDDSQLIAKLVEGHRKDLAELSPRGDVVHYVTSAFETLPILARWYTLDPDNAAKIARINQFKPDRRLNIGDTVVIPSYLVRNKVRLTEESLGAMRE